jgi:hypothetical protein
MFVSPLWSDIYCILRSQKSFPDPCVTACVRNPVACPTNSHAPIVSENLHSPLLFVVILEIKLLLHHLILEPVMATCPDFHISMAVLTPQRILITCPPKPDPILGSGERIGSEQIVSDPFFCGTSRVTSCPKVKLMSSVAMEPLIATLSDT